MKTRKQVVLLTQESEKFAVTTCQVHGSTHLCPLTGACLACLATQERPTSLMGLWWGDKLDKSGTLSDDVFVKN